MHEMPKVSEFRNLHEAMADAPPASCANTIKGTPMSPVCVRIPPEIKARFDRSCRANGKTVSNVLRHWVETYVRELNSVDA